MIDFSTGPEKEHKVAINPNHVTHITPKGMYTWIYLSDGTKHMVDSKYDNVVLELKYWWRDHGRASS